MRISKTIYWGQYINCQERDSALMCLKNIASSTACRIRLLIKHGKMQCKNKILVKIFTVREFPSFEPWLGCLGRGKRLSWAFQKKNEHCSRTQQILVLTVLECIGPFLHSSSVKCLHEAGGLLVRLMFSKAAA